MNILLDKLDFNEEWAYEILKNIIKPTYKICVVPFAFHEKWMKNKEEWEKFYSKINGSEYVCYWQVPLEKFRQIILPSFFLFYCLKY